MATLFLAWRQPDRRWWPVGRLTRNSDRNYEFAYTKGAVEAAREGFQPLLSFPDQDVVYLSPELFPLFSNRLLSEKRPDFEKFVEWMDLPAGMTDPLILLGRSGGRRETDMFEVFSAPERTPEGQYEMTFFVHGLRHRGEDAQGVARALCPDERLELRPDPENPEDPEALAVFARGVHIGFAPRYLRSDLQTLGQDGQGAATVTRVNQAPTPMQFRVLASYVAPWPQGFRPFAGPEFEPLRPDLAAVA